MKRIVKFFIITGICILLGIADPYFAPFAVAAVGFPYGWSFFSRHTGHTFVFGDLFLVALWVFVKFILCAFIGWILIPVDLVRGIKEIREARRLKKGTPVLAAADDYDSVCIETSEFPSLSSETCFCGQCGKRMGVQDRFCTGCGSFNRLLTVSAAQAQ